jgi:hypothetical protein
MNQLLSKGNTMNTATEETKPASFGDLYKKSVQELAMQQAKDIVSSVDDARSETSVQAAMKTADENARQHIGAGYNFCNLRATIKSPEAGNTMTAASTKARFGIHALKVFFKGA